MIEVRISASGVEKVVLLSSSSEDEDRNLAAWRMIRHLVERIDKSLKGAPPTRDTVGSR